jgi:hypothetical protein
VEDFSPNGLTLSAVEEASLVGIEFQSFWKERDNMESMFLNKGVYLGKI